MPSRASQPANPYVGITYLADNARMEIPPAWFLQRLHDYDADLVVVPSRQRPYAYVIARRLRTKRWSQAQIDSTTQPDTRMCMHYGLIPVCLMFKHGPIWNADTILAKLQARDLWAHGGGDKSADLLEQQEAAEQQTRDAEKRDELWHLSGDAWRSYQARTGQRVIHSGPSHPGAATSSSSSRTAPGPIVSAV